MRMPKYNIGEVVRAESLMRVSEIRWDEHYNYMYILLGINKPLSQVAFYERELKNVSAMDLILEGLI